MAKRQELTAEVHDHFAKANVLHGYCQEHMGEASKYALETGEYLLAAKLSIPHGGWGDECERLFDGSARLASSYMQFAKHMAALPKTQKSVILFLEGTIDGAAKAAKKAANPEKPKPPEPDEPEDEDDDIIDADFEPVDDEEEEEDTDDDTEEEAPFDYGKCPNCLGTKWTEDDDGAVCAKCNHPHGEPAGDVDDDRLNTQRQKTVKTGEALMRCFDDLQTLKGRPEHGDAIVACKLLVKTAREWK